jgi:hypothetical protein
MLFLDNPVWECSTQWKHTDSVTNDRELSQFFRRAEFSRKLSTARVSVDNTSTNWGKNKKRGAYQHFACHLQSPHSSQCDQGLFHTPAVVHHARTAARQGALAEVEVADSSSEASAALDPQGHQLDPAIRHKTHQYWYDDRVMSTNCLLKTKITDASIAQLYPTEHVLKCTAHVKYSTPWRDVCVGMG